MNRPPSNSNVWTVYRVHPDTKGESLYRRVAAKFLLHDNQLHVLEDHANFKLEERSPENVAKFVQSLQSHPSYELVNLQSHIDGHHPDLIPVVSTPKTEGPNQSMFDYHRHGYDQPQRLVMCGNVGQLDGHDLSSEELHTMHQNVKNGLATLRHVVQPVEDKLGKVEPDLSHALNQVRQAVASGGMHPDVLRTLNRHIFTDTLIPSMGNKRAYHDFLSRPKKGFGISLDANNFKHINSTAGHIEGDNAIKILGDHIRSAMDEAVGRKNGKLFRPGGDEFFAHVPTLEHATAFSANLRDRLEKAGPFMGQFKISVSAGIGHTPDHAEQALIMSKGDKKKAAMPKGQAASHITVHPESKTA